MASTFISVTPLLVVGFTFGFARKFYDRNDDLCAIMMFVTAESHLSVVGSIRAT